jgi:hypothetical protein
MEVLITINGQAVSVEVTVEGAVVFLLQIVKRTITGCERTGTKAYYSLDGGGGTGL